MKTTCHLTDSIIELTLEAPAGSDVAAHHQATCSTCRSAAERARRSLDVWRADVVSPAEIAAARARLASRAATTAPSRRPVWVLAIALVVMSGGALAALKPWAPAEPPRPIVKLPEATAQIQEPPRSGSPAPENEASTEPGAANAAVAADAAKTATAEAMPRIAAPTPPEAPRLAATASSAREVGPHPSPESPAPAASQGWRDVADAMRKGDKTAADSALGELTASKDPATRDAARLARAELAISSGRRADAQATLADLAANGATPLVRKRATELLAAH